MTNTLIWLKRNLNISRRQYKDLSQLQVRATDVVLLVMLLVTPFTITQTIIRIINLGWSWVMYFHLPVYMTFIGLYVWRHQLSKAVKTYAFAGCFFVIAITATISMENVFYGVMYGSIATLILVTLNSAKEAIIFQLLLFVCLMITGLFVEPIYTWVFIKALVNLAFSIAMVSLIGVMITALDTSLHMEQVIARTERERIYKELHDGLGLHINSALHLLQHGSGDTKDEVITLLHESLDQIRLSIDAMNIPSNDVNLLLAGLRHRLGNRLNFHGIELNWKVEDLPTIDRFNEDDMRHLQHILYEILSNVLQHSKATVLSINAYSNKRNIHIAVAENGIGFNVDAVNLNGIKQMRARANVIEAKLAFSNSPLITEVQLLLPLEIKK